MNLSGQSLIQPLGSLKVVDFNTAESNYVLALANGRTQCFYVSWCIGLGICISIVYYLYKDPIDLLVN